ncbi:MAG: hypothetical protein OEY18_04350 [Candidatus Aminicenantes bacterium]|nr:hypothetical protein [Candidatus Aminicenantes bacterium]MDH5383920.1 hypothetical protein [Candidatus Aminicenantes bacterium]
MKFAHKKDKIFRRSLRDADIVLWKGHPLSTWGETHTVIVNGKIVFER